MSKRVLIIQNSENDAPELLEEVLREHAVDFSLIHRYEGDAIPALDEFDALVVLGGPQSANDDSDEMRAVLNCVREAARRKLPYLGVCLGLQVLVKACGGTVVKSPVRESGLRDPNGGIFHVVLTDEGRRDPLLSGLDERIPVFQMHGETVVLAENMALLASGEFCENQIVRIGGTMYGTQFHGEVRNGGFEAALRGVNGIRKLNEKQLRADWEMIRERYTRIHRRFFGNFLNVADLIERN